MKIVKRLIDARAAGLITEEKYQEYVKKNPDTWDSMKIEVEVPDQRTTTQEVSYGSIYGDS
ncbi:MAG TPA: hypothetical protein PK659_08905 [Methanothrix sp.]|nr:hypothetical protein [Methanothrix sp.]HOL44355.1 hypothetical protein [Methanothrix sp.]